MLMLIPHDTVRGAIPKHTPLLVEGLEQLGCEVTTAKWGRRRDDESTVEKMLTRFKDIVQIREILRSGRFDVFVIKTAFDWLSVLRDLPLALATRRLRPKTILQCHGSRSDLLVQPGNRLFKFFARKLLTGVDGVLALSSEEKSAFQKFMPDLKVETVENPFRPEQYGFEPLKRLPEKNGKLSGGCAKILFVGRLLEAKGLFELLEAAKLLKDDAIAFELQIVGDGPEEQALTAKIEHLGLKDCVRLSGFQSGAALQKLYLGADVFTLPSWSEGFPTVVTEAMYHGLPVVTTKIRGMADHLDENVNALFAPVRSPEKLAQALRRVVCDEELRVQMREANCRKVEFFSPPKVARRFLRKIVRMKTNNDPR